MVFLDCSNWSYWCRKGRLEVVLCACRVSSHTSVWLNRLLEIPRSKTCRPLDWDEVLLLHIMLVITGRERERVGDFHNCFPTAYVCNVESWHLSFLQGINETLLENLQSFIRIENKCYNVCVQHPKITSVTNLYSCTAQMYNTSNTDKWF